MDPESEIWRDEAPLPRIESVRDRLTAAPASAAPQPRCDAHSVTGCLACAVQKRDQAAQELAIARQPAAAPPTPAQPPAAFAPAPTTEPVPEVVRLAQELANAITACSRLGSKIAGLEAALEFSKNELLHAESAKSAVKEALHKLVSEELP